MEDEELDALLNPHTPPILDPQPQPQPEQPSGANPAAGGTTVSPPIQPPPQPLVDLDEILGGGVDPGMEKLLEDILDESCNNPSAPTALETIVGEAYTEDQLYGIDDDFIDGIFNNPNAPDPFGLNETNVGGGQFTEADLWGEGGEGDEGMEQMPLQNQPPFHVQITLGLINLTLHGEDNLVQIINQRKPHIPSYDAENMTTFERVVRSFSESFCARARRPTLFTRLRLVCQFYGGVTPHVLRALVNDDALRWAGVVGQTRIKGIRDIAWSYFSEEDYHQQHHAILTDFLCENMASVPLLRILKLIHQVGPYRAFTMLVFGLGRLDFVPSCEQKFRLRYHNFSGHLLTAQEIESEFEGLAPYRGLAAWLIWKWA